MREKPWSYPAAHGVSAIGWDGWVGRALIALVGLLMLSSSALKLLGSPGVVDRFIVNFGFARSDLSLVALIELACAVLFLIPRTRLVGAVLLTAYLGGAVAMQLSVGESLSGPVFIGSAAWLAIFLHDGRLLPLVAALPRGEGLRGLSVSDVRPSVESGNRRIARPNQRAALSTRVEANEGDLADFWRDASGPPRLPSMRVLAMLGIRPGDVKDSFVAFAREGADRGDRTILRVLVVRGS